MLNLNYNINDAVGGGNGCRGEVKFNYSASFFLAGGGGGGAAGGGGGGSSLFFAGGGGGGAQAFSSSINIIPNVTYQINIGASGSGGINSAGLNAGANGQQSSFVYFDDTDTTGPITLIASGGLGAPGNTGGTSGNGFAGGAPGALAGGTKSGGGGGGTQQNGENGDVDGAGAGGDGGNFGGGGGGAARNSGVPGAGIPYNSINVPGTIYELDVTGISGASGGSGIGAGNAGSSATFAGGGGGSSDSFSTSFKGGDGGQGILRIAYKGKQKAFGGTITYNAGEDITTHTFTSGSHTFLYTYPYPWEDVVPYTVEVCPNQHNEDVRPEIYWDFSYSSSLKRFPVIAPFVSSSYATMSISAVGTNCVNIATTNNNVFTTDGQGSVTASLTGSNWSPTGSVTMSINVFGITYDPSSFDTFQLSSFSSSADVYNLNPSITGSIITSSFLASEFYRYYVSASLVHNYGVAIPTGGLIQWLDASDPLSYPGSGSVWYDLSGYGHNASASFGSTFPTWSDNIFNFNGTSDTVTSLFTSSLSAFSLVVWAKIASLTPPFSSSSGGALSLVSASAFPENPSKVKVKFDSLTFDENKEDKWEIATENNERDVTSSLQETNTNDFLMISMTNAGILGSQKLYRNTTLVGSGSKGSQYLAGTGSLMIVGNRYYPNEIAPGYAPEGFFTGSIIGTLIYNRELSTNEIIDIFNAGT